VPLDKSLVLTSNGEELAAIGGEFSTEYVLTVTGVAARLVRCVEDGISVKVNKAVVIARNKKRLVVVGVDVVDVRAILVNGVHSLHVPAELDGDGIPLSVLEVGEAGGVLDLVFNVKVELLVVSTASTDVLAVGCPVKSLDVRTMLGEVLVQFVLAVFTNLIDIKVIVVGGNSKVVLAGGVSCHLRPLLVLQRSDLLVEVVEVTNANLSHVVHNCDVLVLGGENDGTRLLVSGVYTLG